jgi:major type 1 subunit fimbrin (pilin)
MTNFKDQTMKNIKIASAIALALGIAAAGSASAADDGGTISFTGALTDTTCSVHGGPGTDGGAGNIIVPLDSIPVSSLGAAGANAAWKAFQIIIGGVDETACASGTIGNMYFLTSSPRIDAATGALINALPGEATNAQVQVTRGDAAHTPINLANSDNGTDFTISSANTATVNYGAQYLSTGAATAGLVGTSVVYAIDYR